MFFSILHDQKISQCTQENLQNQHPDRNAWSLTIFCEVGYNLVEPKEFTIHKTHNRINNQAFKGWNNSSVGAMHCWIMSSSYEL